MDFSTLNQAQILFHRHFPEILTQCPDPDTNEYSFKNPLNGYKNDLTIDTIGLFNAKNPPYRGFFTDFLTLAEGVPPDMAFEEFDKIRQNIFPPDMEQIKKWHDALFTPLGVPLLDYLTKERGLTVDTIKKYLLGFNDPENELVFPALNSTRKNPVSVKFTKFPFSSSPTKNKIRVVGPSYFLGYHNLKFNREDHQPKYITTNELDALYLRQLGLEVYCSLTNYCYLETEWYSLFKNLDTIILGSLDAESLISPKELRDGDVKSIKQIDLKKKYISDYFVNDNKLIDDFKAEVERGKYLTSDFFNNLETLRIIESNKDDIEKINGPQDFSKIGFIYGTKISGNYYFLTSKGILATETQLAENGVCKRKEFNYSGVTADLATKFGQQTKSVMALHVFNAIKRYIKKYIFFKDESYYDLLTTWAMGTYVFTIFEYFPYINIQAEKNSGKSQFMKILAAICFNGKHYVSITGAVLFREADSLLRTMFLDEFEKASQQNQTDARDLLNSGFQRATTVTRVTAAAKGGLVDYNVYCPKMFAGINGINDVLQSRTIHIKMLRKLADEKVDYYRPNVATNNFQKNLREDLYMFGLQYAEEIREIYNNQINSLVALKPLENRELDIWGPLFVIASIIDKESKNTVLSDSLSILVKVQSELQAEKNNLENPTSRLLSKLDETLNKLSYVKKDENDDQIILKYLTDDVFDEFYKDKEWKREISTKVKLTLLLKGTTISVRPENINRKSRKCYIIDVAKLIDYGNRYGAQFTFNNRFSQQSKPGSIFIPERVIITKDSENASLTKEMLERIKLLNPKVEVITSENEKPELPSTLAPSEQNEYLRQTVVLATRKSPFIFTFPSPGNIVEGMTTILQMSYFCHSNCTFCYLHDAGQDPLRWRKMYTNFDDLENQINKEQLVYRAALTLWSAISFYKGESLPKIPKGFNELIDSMRTEFNSTRSKIKKDTDVKRYLTDTLADKFAKLDLPIDYKKLEPVKKDISKYYRENLKHKLFFNVSEFSDIVKTDHISNYLEYLMVLLQKNKEFRFKFHTQSANLDNLLKYPGDNRVEITMDFNTEYVINKYCEGTSSLDERIEAAKKILSKKGFLLKISIEPIITYPGYETDYLELAERLKNELDLSSEQVKTIKIGCIRISPALMTMIKSNFPNTELFDEASPLEQPVSPDPKHRYELRVRKSIYKLLLDKFSLYHAKTYISCELPELWKEMGLNSVEHLKTSVYQFTGK